MELNSDNICRICLSHSSENMFQVSSTFTISNQKKTLKEIIFACTSVQLNTEEILLNSLCESCTSEAVSAYAFKYKCEQSEQLLRSELLPADTGLEAPSFICKVCLLNFETQDEFNMHLAQHWNNWTCDMCAERYLTKRDFDQHLLLKHIVDVGQSCLVCTNTCNDVFDLDNPEQSVALSYELGDEPPELTINNAGEIPVDLLAGGNVFIIATEQVFDVNSCEKIEIQETVAEESHDVKCDGNAREEQRGRRLVMKDLLNQVSKEDEQAAWYKIFKNASDGNENGEFECMACTEVFESKQKLHKHTQEHKFFKCKMCTKSFTILSNLRRHLRTHMNEPDLPVKEAQPVEESPVFRCKGCPTVFASRKLLAQHVKSHGLFTCEECGANFTFVNNLNRHMRTHREEVAQDKFKDLPEAERTCSVCSKVFKYRAIMLKHRRSHEIRGFGRKCKFCGRLFATALKLYEHWVDNHPEQRTAACDVCGKKFFKKANLKIHQNIHTGKKGYECEVCGARYPTPGTLGSHRRSHSLKSLECETCGKKFAKQSLLSIHETKHTKFKRFVCEACGANFSRSDSLRNHTKMHQQKRLTAKNSAKKRHARKRRTKAASRKYV